MYHAECRTVSSDQSPDDSRIASVYPFVVMASPGWLAKATFDKEKYERHLEWLMDLGEFIWLIDDAADLQDDLRSDEYNIVAKNEKQTW